MSFTQFIKPYPDGYEDFEVGGTPVTAEILNTNYDGFLLGLNEFLPELAGMVEANPSESATAGNLTKLKVGNSIYLVPSGGSGGSTVEWEQIQLTGTKIATITIDNVPVDVYAPSGGGSGDEVEWTQILGSGTKIGTITINNTPIDVYAPTPIDVEANPSGSATAGDLTKLKADLDDVSITNVQNGQIIKWNSTTSKWENSNESSGGSGHTIIDENGNSMTARAGLQFTGGANVSDDSTNNKTIVDVASAGGIDGVFIDTDNVIQSATSIPSGTSTYTATEDCVVAYQLVATESGCNIQINDNIVDGLLTGSNYNVVSGNAYLKKGQVIKFVQTSTDAGTYTVYGIQTGTTHSKFQPVIYSTEEREIGVWTDGKPLYQKTYTATITSGTQWIDTGLDAGDSIVESKGVLLQNNGDILTLASGDSGVNAGINSMSVGVVTSGKWAVLFRTNNNDARGNLTLTLLYTKGTDTAGSGSWTPQGVPTHHYSTDEQVVGTYLGETLYEKTFYNLNLTRGSWTTIAHSISNIAKIISFDGIILRTNDDIPFPLNYFESTNAFITTQVNKTNIECKVNISSGDYVLNNITIQYTKSS